LEHAARNHRNFELWCFTWRWGAASAFSVIAVWQLFDSLGMASFLCGLGLGVLVAQAMPWFLRQRILARIRAHLQDSEIRRFVSGSRSVEIVPEGLKVEGQELEILYKWGVIKSIDYVSPRLLVLVRASFGLPIPLSAADAEEFISEARRSGMA
jgi:hypothetical protein